MYRETLASLKGFSKRKSSWLVPIFFLKIVRKHSKAIAVFVAKNFKCVPWKVRNFIAF